MSQSRDRALNCLVKLYSGKVLGEKVPSNFVGLLKFYFRGFESNDLDFDQFSKNL